MALYCNYNTSCNNSTASGGPVPIKSRLWITQSLLTHLALIPSPINHWISTRQTQEQIQGPPCPSPLRAPETLVALARRKSRIWVRMENWLRRNAKGVLTTIYVFSVVHQAIRPMSATSRPLRLTPMWPESPLMEMTLHQKMIEQPMEYSMTLQLLQLRSC